jgi:hypothetical protein
MQLVNVSISVVPLRHYGLPQIAMAQNGESVES